MNLPKPPAFYVDGIIKQALAEDISYIDVTTDLLIGAEAEGEAYFVAKADGVIAGLETAARVFEITGGWDDNDKTKTRFEFLKSDGEAVKSGDVIANIAGNAAVMLKAERVALNLLQHLSGIATITRRFAEAVSGTKAVVADTRKTLPGLRVLQKYAVLCGGGQNHRYNLSAAALVKDNHIDACGGIEKAVAVLKARAGFAVKIEVETRTIEEVAEALKAGADIIMLDNMTTDLMREAVKITTGRVLLEASGNVSLENVREIAETGVDIISIGALTHSVKALDISMKWKG